MSSRGTGMVASSSSVCCMLYIIVGSTSLQQLFKGSCNLHVSGDNIRVDCQQLTVVPLLNSVANAAPASGLSRRMNGVTVSYCHFMGTIPPVDSGAGFLVWRLGMSRGKSSKNAQNPLLGE